MVLHVLRGAEVHGVVGAHEDRVSGEPDQLVGGQIDRHDAAAVETDGWHIGDPLEWEGGEIVTVRVSVERHVEIRAGVRAHRDEADVERRAWCVQELGGFARQVCPDDGGGQPGVRLHPLGDPMAEIDQLRVRRAWLPCLGDGSPTSRRHRIGVIESADGRAQGDDHGRGDADDRSARRVRPRPRRALERRPRVRVPVAVAARPRPRRDDAAPRHPATAVVHGRRRAATSAASAREVLGDDVSVTWNDGTPPSRLPIEFLARFRQPRPARAAVDVERVLWDADVIAEQWPTVPYESVIDSDDGVAAWLVSVATYGFCIVEGTPATVEASQQLIRRVGYIRETIFGGFWDFQADLAEGRHRVHEPRAAPAHRRHVLPRRARAPAPPLPRLRRHGRRVDDGRRVPDRRRAAT